jgi:hypothetical protein
MIAQSEQTKPGNPNEHSVIGKRVVHRGYSLEHSSYKKDVTTTPHFGDGLKNV